MRGLAGYAYPRGYAGPMADSSQHFKLDCFQMRMILIHKQQPLGGRKTVEGLDLRPVRSETSREAPQGGYTPSSHHALFIGSVCAALVWQVARLVGGFGGHPTLDDAGHILLRVGRKSHSHAILCLHMMRAGLVGELLRCKGLHSTQTLFRLRCSGMV